MFKSFIAKYSLVVPIFFAISIYLFCILVFDVYKIEGVSMEPTLIHGDYVIIEKISPIIGFINRCDLIGIVNVRERNDKNKKLIFKRVIAMPNENVSYDSSGSGLDNSIFIEDVNKNILQEEGICNMQMKNTHEFVSTKILGPEDYFVVGDNRNFSQDSRSFGTVQTVEMLGVYFFKFRFFGL